MTIDTSALLTILFAEDGAERFAQAIARADVRLLSAANYLEAGIVVDSQIEARQVDGSSPDSLRLDRNRGCDP
jgi:ribonuclease VapC